MGLKMNRGQGEHFHILVCNKCWSKMIRHFDCIARNYIHNSMQLNPSPICKSDHLGTQPILILTFMILNNRSMVMLMINVKRVVIEQRLTPKVYGYFKSNIPTQIYTYGNGYYRKWWQDTETCYYLPKL